MGFSKKEDFRKKIAYFDVCGTIYEANTTFEFVNYCFKDNQSFQLLRKLSRTILAKVLIKGYNLLFRKDFLKSFYVSYLSKFTSDQLSDLVERFFEEYLQSRQIETTFKLLETFKKEGYEIILISASLDIIIMEVAKRLKVQTFYSSILLFDKTKCSGKLGLDLYGRKDSIFLNEPNLTNSYKAFITDNFNDVNVWPLVDEFLVISHPKDIKRWQKLIKDPQIYAK